MSNQDKSPEVIANPNYTSKSEIERVFSVFDSFKKDAQELKFSSVKDATSDAQPVLTMSSIGKLGRFDLKSALENGLNILRSKGKTIVGIHIRRGDYLRQPKTRFTLVFPAKWYCEWLDGIWNELEDPVLFLCSDDLESVIHDFKKFSPVTWKDLDVKLPERMKDLDIEFYIDFFMLSNCDVVVTSNSNFSFIACMLNQRARMFVRPHWDFSTKFTVFDPWDSDPLLRLEGKQPKFSKSWADVLYVTYSTQGIWVMLKSIFIYLPKGIIIEWMLRAFLGYQIKGIIGIVKSLLSILGWRSVWKTPSKSS